MHCSCQLRFLQVSEPTEGHVITPMTQRANRGFSLSLSLYLYILEVKTIRLLHAPLYAVSACRVESTSPRYERYIGGYFQKASVMDGQHFCANVGVLPPPL